ncbi:MAG: proline racemase family protein [Defluviimonas sp.]|uniref:4-hydroxyproline epimerase n=1 Tax=Albidovulum sp. TaxID=1872424 RepID=UPI001DBDCE8E|nr:proline racemase family protein [Paracoccaceae bacterium]MCC0062870.1 proline racemase family protein [Defluviimonas sp.]
MEVIDSHTEGEPTRVVLSGGPDLGRGPLAARAARLAADEAAFCAGLLREPRGTVAMVAALLVPPVAEGCATGVIYFNAAGPLGMCGHATIGLAVTLAHAGRIAPGMHRFETPVGVVEARLWDAARVTVTNVESYRHRKAVVLEVAGIGRVTGDVAWGGNWFFLTADAPVPLLPAHVGTLTDAARRIRDALRDAGVTGAEGAPIDHVEFNAPPVGPGAQGRNFVLCPDDAYDRSPCGTGSSAKLACLAADGALAPGAPWVQESVIGSRYELSYRPGLAGGVTAAITGRAFVTAETRLLFAADDPYRAGISG